MRKLLFAFWLTLLVSLNAYSQIWQAYRGIWLKGYDNATQAPIPPTGYSALTYFADSLGTYVYDWDSLAWLRIPGAGGGGGGLATADNGLSVNPAGNVRLGGALIQNTSIPGAFTLTFGSTISAQRLTAFNAFAGTTDISARLQINSSTSQFAWSSTSLDRSHVINLGLTGFNFLTDSLTDTSQLFVGARRIQYNYTGNRIFRFSPESSVIKSYSAGLNTANFTIDGATETAVLSSSAGSQIHFNVATPASPLITTQAAENFTISKPQGLMSSSGSLQIGGPDGLVTSLENTESGNTAIFDVRGTNETFSMRSGSGGSALTFDVANTQTGTITFTPDNLNSTNTFRINNASTNGNASIDFRFGGTTEIAIFQGQGTSLMSISNNSIVSSGGADFTIGTSNGPNVIYLEGGTSGTIVLERTSGPNGTVNIFGGNGQAGTSEAGESILIRAGQGGSSGGSGGDMTIRGGSGGSAGAAGGDTFVLSGQGNGGGADGNIIIDALTGFLILSNLPTSNPCGSAPAGTVWSDSGTLKVCP